MTLFGPVQFCGLLLTGIALGFGIGGLFGPGRTGNGEENARSYEAQETLLHDWFLVETEWGYFGYFCDHSNNSAVVEQLFPSCVVLLPA